MTEEELKIVFDLINRNWHLIKKYQSIPKTNAEWDEFTADLNAADAIVASEGIKAFNTHMLLGISRLMEEYYRKDK